MSEPNEREHTEKEMIELNMQYEEQCHQADMQDKADAERWRKLEKLFGNKEVVMCNNANGASLSTMDWSETCFRFKYSTLVKAIDSIKEKS